MSWDSLEESFLKCCLLKKHNTTMFPDEILSMIIEFSSSACCFDELEWEPYNHDEYIASFGSYLSEAPLY